MNPLSSVTLRVTRGYIAKVTLFSGEQILGFILKLEYRLPSFFPFKQLLHKHIQPLTTTLLFNNG